MECIGAVFYDECSIWKDAILQDNINVNLYNGLLLFITIYYSSILRYTKDFTTLLTL